MGFAFKREWFVLVCENVIYSDEFWNELFPSTRQYTRNSNSQVRKNTSAKTVKKLHGNYTMGCNPKRWEKSNLFMPDKCK